MKEKAICFFNFLEGKGLLKSGNVTEEVKIKPQNNDNKNGDTPSTQKKEDNISNTVETDNSVQFEGEWLSTTKKGVSLIITKINSTNFEVKHMKKLGPRKINSSPCPTFELIKNDLICQQFKIIYLSDKNSIYFDGAEYKK